MKLINVLLQEETSGNRLAMGINSAIEAIDPNLNYTDFAQAVAEVIKDEYGTHIIEPFMKELHSHLGLQEGSNGVTNVKELEVNFQKELDQNFSEYDPRISMGEYTKDREEGDPLKGKGFGKLSFMVRQELPDEDFDKAKKWIESKGYKVTDASNWAEDDDDRRYYPGIKFELDL
jgi:hypothetical protein